MSTATVTRFVSRYFVGQETNGDPIVDQVLWEQTGDAEPVAVMVRGKVTADEWTAATADLAEEQQA
jgi:hypothetical protein